MDTLLQDLRYAVRQLAKNKAFTAVVVLTLALGVGANTAVFSLANWLVLRPLPGVRDADRLVAIGFGRTGRVSFPNYLSLAEQVTALKGLAAEMSTGVSIASEGIVPQTTSADFVSLNFFTVLGARLAAGRDFAPNEAAVGSPPVAIISHRLWTGTFNRNKAVIGSIIQVNGQPVTVIGVAPEGFRGTARLSALDLWLPYTALAPVLTVPPPVVTERRYRGIGGEMFGRLAPGASPEQAQVELQMAVTRLLQGYPAENAGSLTGITTTVDRGLGIPIQQRARVVSTLKVLAAVAAVLLLIAAANVTNLMVFRNAHRRAELSVRRALGAGRARLLGQFILENAVLGALGGAAAILLALWLTGLFRGVAVSGLPAIEQITFDGRVLGFGVVLSILLGSAVALVSSGWRRNDPAGGLIRSGARTTGRRIGGRGVMAVVQVAASLTLLVGALLLVRTLQNLRSADVGFDRSVMSFTLAGRVGYSDERYRSFLRELQPRVAGIPGVESASLAHMSPFVGFSLGDRIRRDGAPPESPGVGVTTAFVSPTYFTTLAIPILAGRPFEDREMFKYTDSSVTPVILSSAVATALYGSVNPVGQFYTTTVFGMNGFRLDRRYEVVGLAGDTRWGSLVGEDAAGPIVYRPMNQDVYSGATLLVRSRLSAGVLRDAVVGAVTALAPAVPVRAVHSLEEQIDGTIAEERLFARVLTLLTVLAVILAGVGLYGLVAFSVAERTKEFGIRIALGAQAREILDLVVRHGAVVTGLGVAFGLAGAVGLSRVIASRLFGVTPLEPYIYILATALLVLVALAASVIPAFAATKADPLAALRSE